MSAKGHGRGRRGGGHGGGEHENSERWLLTYADMMTLLVAFFIMLYAMSVVNVTKFQQLAISVRSGFGGSMTTGAPTILSGGATQGIPSFMSSSKNVDNAKDDASLPVSHKQIEAIRDSHRLDKAFSTVQTYIKQHHLENEMHVKQDERGVIITVLTDKMLFASGQADLRPQEAGLLTEVGHVVNTVPNIVRVEGHTDNLPIHTERYPSNWELSAVRATTVLRYFAGHGVPDDRLEAAGYADRHPVAPNDTEQHRGFNRRVDVVILRQDSA